MFRPVHLLWDLSWRNLLQNVTKLILSFGDRTFFWKQRLAVYAGMSSEAAHLESIVAQIATLEAKRSSVTSKLSLLIRQQIRNLQARQDATKVELESLIETRRWLV